MLTAASTDHGTRKRRSPAAYAARNVAAGAAGATRTGGVRLVSRGIAASSRRAVTTSRASPRTSPGSRARVASPRPRRSVISRRIRWWWRASSVTSCGTGWAGSQRSTAGGSRRTVAVSAAARAAGSRGSAAPGAGSAAAGAVVVAGAGVPPSSSPPRAAAAAPPAPNAAGRGRGGAGGGQGGGGTAHAAQARTAPGAGRPAGLRALDPVRVRRRGGVRRLGLPVDLVTEPGRLEDLEREQRALHPRRRDVDPEQVEDELAVELEQLGDGHALDLVRGHRRRRLRDRAAVAVEAHLVDPPVLPHLQHDLELVAAQRVVVLGLQVRRLHRPPVVGPLVVLEDLLAVEVVHQALQARRRSAGPPRGRRPAGRPRRGWCARRTTRGWGPTRRGAASAAGRSGGRPGRTRRGGR